MEGRTNEKPAGAPVPLPGGRRLELERSELTLLGRLARAAEGREPEIAARWERSHALAVEDRSGIAPGDFCAEALEEVQAILGLLREEDTHGLAERFARRGRELFLAGIPFADVSRCLRHFEESLMGTLDEPGRSGQERLAISAALAALSREAIIHVVEAYHCQCRDRWKWRHEKLLTGIAQREQERGGRDRLCGLIGRSEPMQRVYELLALAAEGRDAVLITGATGTGKEIAARTIHALSGDPPERFVAVNCAALSHELIESELFGHQRGSFSGAHSDHRGLFRAAHGGTLFLDEVTEFPTHAQAKLLRTLQERSVRPVGGLAEIPVDVRIVASTNRPLDRALEEEKLRRDFYYRLRHLVVALPPLAERKGDIPLLVDHLARKAASEGLRARAPVFSEDALRRLGEHGWPGNVRELESVVRLICRRAGPRRVDAADLGPEILDGGDAMPERATIAAEPAEPISIREAERDAIARALEATEGNKTRAAGLLGISRKQLYVKIKQYELA